MSEVKYIINNSKKALLPRETVDLLMEKAAADNDMFGRDQVEMKKYLVDALCFNHTPELHLTIAGENYTVKIQDREKMTNTERIKLLEEEVQELRMAMERLAQKCAVIR